VDLAGIFLNGDILRVRSFSIFLLKINFFVKKLLDPKIGWCPDRPVAGPGKMDFVGSFPNRDILRGISLFFPIFVEN
jgi:hypothetical protein